MKPKAIVITLFAFVSISCAAAQASELQISDVRDSGGLRTVPYQRVVSDLVEGASLTLGKVAHFCATQEGTASILHSYETYLRNMEAGTRAGLIEIGERDNGEAVLTAEGKAMAARTGESILNSAKSNARAACMNFESEFRSGTVVKFKNQVIARKQEYKRARNAYCAKQPRPSNCSVDE